MQKLNLQHLQSDQASVKYHCAKQAIALSEKKPQALYSYLNTFIKLLDGENRVLKWVAIIVIGNLARTDTKNKIDRLVPRLIGFLQEKEMITANNAIVALGKIAAAKPKYKDAIFKALLHVEQARYYNKGKLSSECRNIALGKVIDILTGFPDELKKQKKLIAFIKRQTKNTRPAVRKRAEKLLHIVN